MTDKTDIDVLHEIGSRIAAADPLHTVLNRVVQFVSSMVACDSVLIYVLEGEDLVLRASKRPHSDVVDRLTLRVGEGITGWVAEHKTVVALGDNASQDPRFLAVPTLVEDTYQAFLSVPVVTRGRTVGVINVHRSRGDEEAGRPGDGGLRQGHRCGSDPGEDQCVEVDAMRVVSSPFPREGEGARRADGGVHARCFQVYRVQGTTCERRHPRPSGGTSPSRGKNMMVSRRGHP